MATRYRARIVIEGDTKEVRKALRELEQAAGETGVKVKQQFGRGIRGTEAEASSWASRMKKLLSPQNLLGAIGIGAGIAGVGGLLTKVFGGAKSSAADFQEKMAEVSTIVDTAKTNMKDLTKEVSASAREFGKPAVEQAGGLYQIISAGITDTADAMGVLRVATKAGIAGVTDTETAVDGITSVLNAFGLKAEDAGRVSDAMFKTVEKGKVVFRDLSQFMGQAAPTFAAVELPFTQMLAAVATLTASGTKPSQAFEGLRSMLGNVIKPSEQAQKTAHALGVEFNVAALRSKGLVGFLRDITGAAKGNTEVLSQLFGDITGLQVALSLGGTQANRFESDLRAVQESTGATDEAFRKMSETYNQNRRQFQASMEGFKIAFGNQFLPTLTGILEGMTNWSTAMQDNENVSERWRSGWQKRAEELSGWFDKVAVNFAGAEEAGRKSGAAWGRGLSPAAWAAAFKAANEDVPAGMRAGALASESQMGSAGRQAATPWVDAFLAKIRQAKDAVVGLFKSEPEPAPEKDPATFPGPSGGTGGQPPLRTPPSQILGGGAQTTTSPPLSKSPADILRDALAPKPGPVTTPVIPDDPDFYRTPDLEEQNRNSGGGGGGSGGPGGGLIRFMAHGGRRRLGGWSVVGEGGPELLRLPGGAEVIPNSLTQMAFKQGLGGGMTVNLGPINVSGVGSPGEARAIGNEIGSGILERLERLVNL